MKKFISMILVLSMMFMFTLPALAEEAGVDKQLEAVTLKVKNLLDVKDSYTDFSGELNDTGTHSLWSLSWTGDGENLNVCASETGKIASFNYYSDSGSSEPYSGSLLKFPEFTKEQAEKIAADVLSRILDAKTESVSFDGSGEPLRLLRSKGDDYYLNGSLLINSVKTPVRVSLTIDFNTHTVKSFYRSDDAQDYGGFKTPDKAVPSSSASKTLFSTVKMKLAYARRGGDDKTAYLQYTPVNDAEYVVDAFTGSLVNLTELAGYNGGGYASAGEAKTASDAADNGKKHLTDAEQKAVDSLEGVLPKSTLEANARNISELGLNAGFTLTAVGYHTYTDFDGKQQISAGLSFEKSSGSKNDDTYSYANKYVVLDAKKGTFVSVSTSQWSAQQTSKKASYTRAQCEATAEGFAKKYAEKEFPLCAESGNGETSDSDEAFTFNRTENKIPFPENSVNISVDNKTGCIDDFSVAWDNGVKFQDSSKVVSDTDAASAYTKGVGISLRYVSVPEGYENDKVSVIYNPIEKLLLAYGYDKNDIVWGVDAVSGELLKNNDTQTSPLRYGDISGHYAASAIEKLARYGVGFPGPSFKPNAALTQKDSLVLLLKACGFSFDSDKNDTELYQTAYSLGLLAKGSKNPTKPVARGEFVKMIVTAAGYKNSAELKGIYSLKFKDASGIPANLYGYVAVACGLGVVKGANGGSFNCFSAATRAEAAVMLCNYMSAQ